MESVLDTTSMPSYAEALRVGQRIFSCYVLMRTRRWSGHKDLTNQEAIEKAFALGEYIKRGERIHTALSSLLYLLFGYQC